MSIVELSERVAPSHGRTPLSVLRSVHAEGSVKGLLFELAVEQCYLNDSHDNVEAVYTFPVPWDAVLLGVEFVLGEKQMRGVVVAKTDAEQRYERALEDGNTAVMVERASNGLYTVNVGNLLPGEQAVVRFRYAQLLSFAKGHIRLTIPTTIAPRYGNAQAMGLQPYQVPVSDIVATHAFSLKVTLHGELASASLRSPSHGVSIRSLGESVEVGLPNGACLDRDFVLLAEGVTGKSISTLGRDGDGYVALASFCPLVQSTAQGRPLNLKILVDCSGSMSGDRIAASRHALHEVLSHLAPEDRFSYSCFGSEVKHFGASLTAALPPAIRLASQWVATTEADMGGTEIKAALLSTFALAQPFEADILLITDGDVWEEEALISKAEQAGQRVFAVGIGSAPASSLLHGLSRRTGGACELVSSDTEVQSAIVRMFRRMRQAPVREVTVEWEDKPVWHTEPNPIILSDETVHQFAGFANHGSTKAVLSWYEGRDNERRSISASMDAAVVDGDTLARVAAAVRSEALMPSERHALALHYELVGATTNLVLVHLREEKDKPMDLPTLKTVAHTVPAGWGGIGSNVGLLKQPAVWRREQTSDAMKLASNSVELYDIPAFLRKDRQALPKYVHRESLRSFADAFAIDAFDSKVSVPTSLSLETLASDLPALVIAALRRIVADGFQESEVVRLFILALIDRVQSESTTGRLLHVARRIRARVTVGASKALERRVSACVSEMYDMRAEDERVQDIPA